MIMVLGGLFTPYLGFPLGLSAVRVYVVFTPPAEDGLFWVEVFRLGLTALPDDLGLEIDDYKRDILFWSVYSEWSITELPSSKKVSFYDFY
jgi:hypothetical protein